MSGTTTQEQDLMELLSKCTLHDTRKSYNMQSPNSPGLTTQSARGSCILSLKTNPNTPLPTLTKSQKEESLHILSLTEIRMDTLATHLSLSGYDPPKEDTLDFAANFVSAASIASGLVLKRPVTVWDVQHLIPTQRQYPSANGTCLDLSTSMFDIEGSRSSVAVDIAATKYRIDDYECFNTSILARDARVIDVNHPIVSELVKRRDDYVARKKGSCSRSRHLRRLKQKQD
jgi:hypothetical protein